MSDSDRVVTIGGIGPTQPYDNFVRTNIGRGNAYYVDPVNGSSTAGGRSPDQAVDSLATAYGLATANQNDVIYCLPGVTGSYDTLAAPLTWAKNHTHVIGLCAPTRVSQRSRVTYEAALATMTSILTVSAYGCMFKDMQFSNFGSDAAAIGGVIVTGARNYFENVNMIGAGNATPRAVAGASDLFLNGAEENTFKNCTIGLDTVVRATNANAILKFDGDAQRNTFEGCKFISACETSTFAMVEYVDSGAVDRYTIFDNCIFYNFSANHAATLAECFDIPAIGTHDVLLKHCMAVGIDEWCSATTGSIWIVGGTPAAGTAGSGSTGIAVEPS